MLGDAISRNEGEIVARCQEGDREAFGWIVEEYGDLLYGSAMLMTRDRLLAEDLVQETLLSAWRSISSFKPDKPVKPWIMKILVNEVRMHMRRKRPDASAAARVDPDSLVQMSGEFSEVEMRSVLQRALGHVSDEQRQVLVLRYFADLSIAEVAKAARLRQGTVKSRVHRGLEIMRDALNKEEER